MLTQAMASFTVRTRGPGFTEVTAEVGRALADMGAGDGLVTIFLRHTSASLTIQENADPDVTRDLLDALDGMAPRGAGYRHGMEGPDDMPAHIRAMLTGVSLQVPVVGGRMMLGTWQGIWLIEHRDAPHEREIVVQFIGEPGQ